MEPIRRFPPALYATALDSWSFLDFAGKSPVFTSPFGDVFFQANDGFWFLDVLAGELRHSWSSQDELNAELNSRSGQDEYLMISLASQAENSGLQLGEGEVYSFRVPPVLGGATEIDNVEVSDFVVALDIAGQIHKQVLTLPPGYSDKRHFIVVGVCLVKPRPQLFDQTTIGGRSSRGRRCGCVRVPDGK